MSAYACVYLFAVFGVISNNLSVIWSSLTMFSELCQMLLGQTTTFLYCCL